MSVGEIGGPMLGLVLALSALGAESSTGNGDDPAMEGAKSNCDADDRTLAEDQERSLREIASRGGGELVLFVGRFDAGKTNAAALIAAEKGLEIYRIDSARVVSKYIGETEKNLARILDRAEESEAVLLFDEADALFGKRSGVKDAHDRYANIEVSYLLQRMESYSGIIILASDSARRIDPVILGRVAHIVEFADSQRPGC